MLTSEIRTCKRIAAAALITTILSACSTVETQSFQVNQDSAVESSQVATNADFSKYRQLHAVDMGIFFPEGSFTSLSSASSRITLSSTNQALRP